MRAAQPRSRRDCRWADPLGLEEHNRPVACRSARAGRRGGREGRSGVGRSCRWRGARRRAGGDSMTAMTELAAATLSPDGARHLFGPFRALHEARLPGTTVVDLYDAAGAELYETFINPIIDDLAP